MSAPGAPVAPDHDVRALLAVRPFRALWLSNATSSTGDWLGLLATTALASRLGAGTSYAQANLAVAGVLVLRLAPAVLFGSLAGAIADRWDRRTTMVVGDVLRAGLFVTIPLVGTLWWLFAATLLIEVVSLFWTPAKDASVPNLVPAERLEAANQLSLVAAYGTAPLAAALFSVLALVTQLLPGDGSALGGRVGLALYADAATYLVAAAVVARLRIPRARVAGPPPSLLRSVLDGWRFVVGTPLVRGLVVGMLGAFAAGGFVIGVAPAFVRDLGGGEAGYGVLFGCVFAGMAVGVLTGPRLLVALARWRLFALSIITAGVLLLATALVGHLEIVAGLCVLIGACGGVAWVTGYTLLGLEVADEVRGRTFGFVASAARIVLLAVIAAAPALAAAFGRHRLVVDGTPLVGGGAAWTLVVAAVVAAGIGLLAHHQLDDGSGNGLRADLARAWRLRRTARPEPVARRAGGFFLALEGGDGAGKSTQVAALAQWLRSLGHDVVTTREPGATALGARVRDLLLHGPADEALAARAEALLYAADRAQHVAQVVRPALDRGALVITDRYTDSSVAYQGAGRALDAEEVSGLSRWATGDLLPDLTVVLDLTPEAARRRLGGDLDRLEREPEAFHAAVRARFLELARRSPRRYVVVDADAAPEVVTAALREQLAGRVPASPRQRAQAVTERAAAERERAEAVADRARADAARRADAAALRSARREAATSRRRERLDARRSERQAEGERREAAREQARAAAEARAADRAARDAERRAAAELVARQAAEQREAEAEAQRAEQARALAAAAAERAARAARERRARTAAREQSSSAPTEQVPRTGATRASVEHGGPLGSAADPLADRVFSLGERRPQPDAVAAEPDDEDGW